MMSKALTRHERALLEEGHAKSCCWCCACAYHCALQARCSGKAESAARKARRFGRVGEGVRRHRYGRGCGCTMSREGVVVRLVVGAEGVIRYQSED